MEKISDKIYTEKKVKSGLISGRFVAKKPGKNCTAGVYNVFDAVYHQKTGKKIQWYRCRICSELKFIVLRTHGNAQMARHKCYINFEKTKQSTSKESRRPIKRKSTKKGE